MLQTQDGGDDMKKGTQLLEVYALEIQMYTVQKNNKKLKNVYEQSLHIKSAIPHPFTMGVIRGEFAAAQQHFVVSFKASYDWNTLSNSVTRGAQQVDYLDVIWCVIENRIVLQLFNRSHREFGRTDNHTAVCRIFFYWFHCVVAAETRQSANVYLLEISAKLELQVSWERFVAFFRVWRKDASAGGRVRESSYGFLRSIQGLLLKLFEWYFAPPKLHCCGE